MTYTQSALLLLLLFWGLQIGGGWMQWRNYRRSLHDATSRWSDGFLGVGRSKATFSKGAAVLLAVDPDLRVRQLQAMTGISVMARFENDPSAHDRTLDELAARYPAGRGDTPLGKAVRQAIEQVRQVAARAA